MKTKIAAIVCVFILAIFTLAGCSSGGAKEITVGQKVKTDNFIFLFTNASYGDTADAKWYNDQGQFLAQKKLTFTNKTDEAIDIKDALTIEVTFNDDSISPSVYFDADSTVVEGNSYKTVTVIYPVDSSVGTPSKMKNLTINITDNVNSKQYVLHEYNISKDPIAGVLSVPQGILNGITSSFG